MCLRNYIIPEMTRKIPPAYRYDDVRLDPADQIGLHSHPEWELSYVLVGAGKRIIGDRESSFGPGDLVLIPPDIPHCWCFSDNSADADGKIANITVCFNQQFLDSCAATFPGLAGEISSLSAKCDAISFDADRRAAIVTLLEGMRGETERERSVSMLRLVSVLMSPGNDTTAGRKGITDRVSRRLDSVRIYTDCNLSRDITISDVAAHAGMNRSAFCSFFKKATGKTYVSYLNRLRIERVCRLLLSETVPVSVIAYSYGFNDIPYFNRRFRKVMGMSPIQYRRSQSDSPTDRDAT